MLASAAVGPNPHVFSILSPHSVPAFSGFRKQMGLRGAGAMRPGANVRDGGAFYRTTAQSVRLEWCPRRIRPSSVSADVPL
jgi:hypothetical protein